MNKIDQLRTDARALEMNGDLAGATALREKILKLEKSTPVAPQRESGSGLLSAVPVMTQSAGLVDGTGSKTGSVESPPEEQTPETETPAGDVSSD